MNEVLVGEVESDYNGHTLQYIHHVASALGDAGAPWARVAEFLGFQSMSDLQHVPGVRQVYNDARLARIVDVGVAMKRTAMEGNYAAQRFILEVEADWLKRGEEVREDIQRLQAEMVGNLDPEQVLKQLLAADMARLNRLPMNSTEFDKVADRVRENATMLARLRKDVAATMVDVDMSSARASSEYARLRMTYSHLPDDELPAHIQKALAGLEARVKAEKKP